MGGFWVFQLKTRGFYGKTCIKQLKTRGFYGKTCIKQLKTRVFSCFMHKTAKNRPYKGQPSQGWPVLAKNPLFRHKTPKTGLSRGFPSQIGGGQSKPLYKWPKNSTRSTEFGSGLDKWGYVFPCSCHKNSPNSPKCSRGDRGVSDMSKTCQMGGFLGPYKGQPSQGWPGVSQNPYIKA